MSGIVTGTLPFIYKSLYGYVLFSFDKRKIVVNINKRNRVELCKKSKFNKNRKKCLQKLFNMLLCGCNKGTEYSRKGFEVSAVHSKCITVRVKRHLPVILKKYFFKGVVRKCLNL